MIKLNVKLGDRSYPIYVTTDYAGLGKCISEIAPGGSLVLVTDSNVDSKQAEDCLEAVLSAGFKVEKYVIEAGEKNKNLDTVSGIYKFLLEKKADRHTTIIALGGGVVGDITGFTAATYMRGINYVQVPTTTLSQADSSVGGKTGVDFEGGKNIIGAFYQPRLVYINVNSLRTLPKREFVSGLAEVVKHGIIRDQDFFEFIGYSNKRILSYDEDTLQYLAKVNCSIKSAVVEEDEKEDGLRAILNFGHTFGHAVESASDFRLLHGEAVSIGIIGAFLLAQKLQMVDGKLLPKVRETLEGVGLPVRFEGIDPEKVYQMMFMDKKAKDGKLNFVLPKRIGDVVKLTVENEVLIKEVISELGR